MAKFYVDENGKLRELKDGQQLSYTKDKNGKTQITIETIAPVKNTQKTENRTWFTKGAFSDGYDFGDVTKTILGTVQDVSENVTAGILGMGESVVDAGAYAAGAVGGIFDKGFKKDMQEFIAKDLYDEKEVAKKVMPFAGILGNTKDSVLGDKTDSLAQSGGQLLGTIGLQAVGVPWFVTTGVTSFGSASDQALNEGASFEQAGLSAAISAGAEILTEKLFGGSGLGEKGLINLDGLTKGISGKLVKSLADFGLDMAAEGSEEIVASVAGRFASSLYKEEKLSDILFSEEAFDEYLESFIGGAALGGIMNTGKVSSSIKKGEDYRSGLTNNEQKVFDKLYENEVKEAEKDGKTLSKKDKAKIYDEVMDNLEKGNISTDTIEEILGGEDAFKTYNDLKAEADEYKTLYETKSGDLSEAQRDRLAELKAKNAQNSFDELLKAERDNISKSVLDTLAKDRKGEGSKLFESYNEKARRGQAFEADLSTYKNENQREIVKKAVESGILNNTRRTHEFVDMVSKISADKGVSFDFTNNERLKKSGFAKDGRTINGYVTKDGITLNVNSAKALNSVVGHEITHVLEGTELYSEMQKALFEYAKTKKDFEGRRKTLEELYKDVKDADIDAELTADLVGDYLFTDADFIKDLSVKNRNVFQKIYDEIKYLCKVVTAGSKEARQLEEVKRKFEQAYKESAKGSADTKYSYSYQTAAENPDILKLVEKVENGNFKANDKVDLGTVSPDIAEEIQALTGINVDGFKVAIEARQIEHILKDHGKNGRSDKSMSDPSDIAKIEYAIENHEDLRTAGKTQAYTQMVNGKNRTVDTVLYEKAIGEKAYYVVQAVPDTKAKTLYIVTAFIGKKGYKKEVSQLINANSPDATSKNGSANTSDNSISQNSEKSIGNAKFSLAVSESKHSVDAIERFGTTSNFEQAGFVLENGRMLKLSKYGLNGVQHKLIEAVYDDVKGNDAINRFIQEGNVRIKASSPGIEIGTQAEVSVSQLNTLSRFISGSLRGKGVFYLDITDADGNEVASITYDADNSASDVIYDIKDFYNNGTIPERVRYSLSDSDGNKLTNEQSEYFKDSKVVDENGRLKVMYHGTPNGDFTVFKDGTYFTENKWYADLYQNPGASSISTGKVAKNPKTFEVYLNIKKPFDLSDPEAKNIYINDYIKGGNAVGINPYLSDAEYNKIDTIDWTEGEDLREFLIDNGYDYDGLVLDEGATGGYGDDVKSRGKSYVVFSPEQVKSVANEKPTSDPDIRFSLSKEGAAPRRFGNYNVKGEEISLDLGPVREDIAKNATTTTENVAPDFAPISEEEANALQSENIASPDDAYAPIKATAKSEAKAEQPKAPPKIAEILTEEPEAPKKKERSAFMMARTALLDKFSVFEDLALKKHNRELMGKANHMLSSESRAQHMIGNGIKSRGVKPLNDIRAQVENSGLTKDFYNYLHHLHNVDRMSLEANAKATIDSLQGKFGHLKTEQIYAIAAKEITDKTTARTAETIRQAREYVGSLDAHNKPVFGDDVTADVSRQTATELEKAHPEFKAWAKDVYDYNNYLREILVKKGVISQEAADLWAKIYPHYVPIRRAGKDGAAINVALDTNKTGVNAPIKRATGGNGDILPMFDTMALRTEQTYKAAAKNAFGVELMNVLGTRIENSKANLDEVLDSVDNHEELLKKGERGQAPTFTVFENGERVTFEITEDMYDALKPTSDGLKYKNKILGGASSIMRGLLTEYNPVFTLTNAVKDAQDVLLNSQHAVKTYLNFPKAVKEILTSGKLFTEYIENGGEQNTYFDSEAKIFTKDDSGIKKLIGIPFNAISKANNFVERIPRLAEYIASREAGRSIEVSMLDAARVTTNFQAGGDVTKFLNRNGATFLNASVQGANQQVRNIREAKANGLKGVLTLAAKFAVAGLPALLLNHLLWDDDEEYAELSDYVKDNYYVIAKNSDGTFVRIPKGRTLAVIQDAFEQMENLITGNDEVDLMNFGELLISNLAPNNPIDNNVFAPIIQAHTNKTWYGEDLVPTRLQDLPNDEQYDESTDAISKWLGEKTGLSPYRLNYLLNQYSGGLGDVFLPMMTPEAERGDNSFGGNLIAPLKDKFTTSAVTNNQKTGDFYDTMDELTKRAKSSKATDEDILKYKYFSSVNSKLGELYGQKREIQNSDLSNKEKYAKALEIQEQINALTRNSLEAYNDVYIDEYYATVGDLHYRLDDGTWTKISDKQLERQNEVTQALGITPSEYWRKTDISFMPMRDGEYEFAVDSPGRYAISKAVGGYDTYLTYSKELYDIKADKDANGDSIAGSRKKKVAQYINNLDADYETKIILYKSEYPSDNRYNYEIISYLNSREDLTYSDIENILKQLGFEVDSKGNISW